MELPDDQRCTDVRPVDVILEARCVYAAGHIIEHADSHAVDAQTWGHRQITDCRDCDAIPGQPHDSGCDVERCSVCGGQWIGCGCEGHDPIFARWTGLYPGAAEAKTLGIDLNEFHRRRLHEVFFVKPTPAR